MTTEKTIHIDLDTLEYTREGLRSKEPFPVTVGQNNKVVLVRPTRYRPVRSAATGFPTNSAFPLPGTLAVGWSVLPLPAPFAHSPTRSTAARQNSFQVFGHASATGEDAYNKSLADRRAKVGAALLQSSLDPVLEVASEEQWGLQHAQAMLRTLGLDPGPCDGEEGRHTSAALTHFVDRYNRQIFHRTSPTPPAIQGLEPDGQWSDEVGRAIIDAFVAAHGAAVPEANLVRSSGCSEFNLVDSDRAAPNRRLSVIASPTAPPYPESAPCTDGDIAPCALVDDNQQRCMWYREHVADPKPPEVEVFAARWLWLGEDKYLLSALTTAGDDVDFTFEVFDRAGDDKSTLHTVERVRPILGTLNAVWVSGVDSKDVHGQPGTEDLPIFEVSAAESPARCSAKWPERVTARVLFGASDSASLSDSAVFKLTASDGSYESSLPLSAAQRVSPQKVALEFESVPDDALVCLSFGASGEASFELFRDVQLIDMLGNCSLGNECKEIPPLAPPTLPPDGLPEHLDGIPDEGDAEDSRVQRPW